MLNDFDLTFDPQNLDSSAVLSINYLRRLTNTSDTGLESEYESDNDAVSLYDLKAKSKLYKSGKVQMDTSVFRYDIIGTNSAPNYETLDDGFRYGDVSVVSSTNEDDFPYDLYTPVEYIQVGLRNGGITLQNILPIYSKECRFEGDVYFPSNWSLGPNVVSRACNNTVGGNKLLSFVLPWPNGSGMNPTTQVHHPVIGIASDGRLQVYDPNTFTSINDTTSLNMTNYFGKKIHIVGSVSKAAAVWNSTDQRVEEVADKNLIPTWTGSGGPGSNNNELHTLKYYFSVQSYEYINLGSGNGYRRQKPDVLVYYPLKTPCKTFNNQFYFINHIEGESVNNYSGPTTLAENLQNDSSIVAYATSNSKLPRWNNLPNTAGGAKYVMQDRYDRNATTGLNDQLAARWGLFGMSYSDLPYPRLNSQNRYFGGCHNLGDFFHAYLDNGGMNHYFNQQTTYPGHGYFLATAFTNTWGETSTRYSILNGNKPSPPSTRIYSGFKLWQDYDLVGDFVTCKRNSDGLYGVYNKIDKVFSCSEYDEWVSQNQQWPWHFTLEGETPGYTIPAIWGDGSLGGYDTYYNTRQASGWNNKPHGGLEYNDNSYNQTNFEYNNYSIAGPIREKGSGNDKAIAYVRIDGTEPVFGKPVTEGVYFDFDHRNLKWNFPSKDNPLKFRVWIDPSVNRNIHASQSQLWEGNTDTMLFGATGTTRPQRWDTEWPTGEEPSLVSMNNSTFASYIHKSNSSLVTNLPIYNQASVVTSGLDKKEGISLVQTTPYYDVSLYFPDPSLNGICGTETGVLAIRSAPSGHKYTNIGTHLSTTVTDNSVFDRYYNQIVFVGDTMSPDSGASSMVTWDKGDGYVRPDYLDYTETPTNRWNSVPVRGYIQHNVRNHSGISVEPDHVSIWPDEYVEINKVSFTWDGEPNPRWNECLWNMRIKDLNEGSYRHKYVYDEGYMLWTPSYDATYENQKPAMGYQIRGVLNYLNGAESLKPAFGTDICLSEDGGPQGWLETLSYLNDYNNYPTFYRTYTGAAIGTETALFYRLCGQRIIPIIDASVDMGGGVNEYLDSNILLTDNGTNSPGAINPWEYIWDRADYIIGQEADLPVLKWPLFMRETPDSSDLNKAKMSEDLDENWTVENLAPFYYDLPDSSYPVPRKMAGKSWQYEFSKQGWVLEPTIFTGEIKNPITALHLMDSSLWKQNHIDLWNEQDNNGLIYYNGTYLYLNSMFENQHSIWEDQPLPSDDPEHIKGLIVGIEIQGWNPDEPVYSANLTAVSSDPDAVTVSLLNSKTAALWGLDDSNSVIGDADLLSSQNEMISAWPDNHPYAVPGFTGSGVQLQYYIVEFLKDQCNCTVTWSNNDGHNNGSVSCNLDVSISRPINTTGSIDIHGDNSVKAQSKRYAVYDPYECIVELLDTSLNALDTLRINVRPDSIANTIWDNFTLITSTDNLAEWSIDSSANLLDETILKIIPNGNIVPNEDTIEGSLSLDSWYKIKYMRVSINPSVLQIPYSDSSTYLGKTGNIITFAGTYTWEDPIPEGRLSSGLFNWFSPSTVDNLNNTYLSISFIKGHSNN